MLDTLQHDAHQSFLASLRTRGSGEIALAAPYVKQAVACVDGACARYLHGADVSQAVKHAESMPVYHGNGFALETKETSAASFKLLLPDGIEPPKHTLMVLRHVVTTPKEDRDKDVLVTSGASVDPSMPLLWQHLIGVPIGKMIAVVDHTPQVLRVATALLDLNDLTADAAKLIEANALRFSHGFRVLEYRERKADNGQGLPGFEVTKFEIMEVSLVSVPSNTDAVVEMYAKGGLSSEPMKRFAKGLDELRQKSFAGVDVKELASEEAAVVAEVVEAPEATEHKCTCQAKATEEETATPEPVTEKAGRVLSKRNLERLGEVKADLQEMHDYEGMPRPCKAMCKTAMKILGEVMDEAAPEEEVEEKAVELVETIPPTPAEQFAAALASSDARTRKRYREALDAAIVADELNQLSEEFAQLLDV
jgi:HK97 family phage prohead protease